MQIYAYGGVLETERMIIRAKRLYGAAFIEDRDGNRFESPILRAENR